MAEDIPTRKSSDVGHASSTRLRPNDAKSLGDLLDLDGALSSVHDQVESCVVIEIRGLLVQIQEDHRRQPGQALVAVEQRVIPGERMEQRRRLEIEAGVGVLSEGARPRPAGRSVKEAHIPNGSDPESSDQPQQVLEVQVLDVGHARPSRSRTSPSGLPAAQSSLPPGRGGPDARSGPARPGG